MVSTRNALHLGPDPLGAGAGSSNLAEEPNSSTSERDFISQEDYQAALLIVTFRDSGTSSTQTLEPLNAPPHARNSEPASPQAEPEPPVPGAGTSTNSNKQKKRRRKGFRLTHVKNERAKKAKARADAATRGTNTSVPGPSRMPTRSRTRRQPTRAADETPRRLTRAAARAQAIDFAERDQRAESSKTKGKGKEVVKGESDSDDVARSSKRRRCDSEDDELDELESPGEPGPSTRRKRQKLDPNPKALDEPAEPPAPVTKRKSHSTAANIQRGVKRYRSLGPEPSEGRIEAERKRARREKTPERDRSEPLATSSRVQLGDTQNQAAAVVVKVEEGEPRSHSRHGADTSRRHHPAANARLRHRPRVAPLERQETTLLDGDILRPEDPLYYLP